MNALICPKCGEELSKTERTYTCPNRHSYDEAASGYVNLLLCEQMNTKLPGDNKLMVNSRRDFLNKGYYEPLALKLCEAAKKYTSDGGTLLDAGCGEGYYTHFMARNLDPKIKIMGTDISKTAVNAAAKRFKGDALLFVSSIFHLPVKDGCADTLTTLFAPFCREEYSRVLKKGGVMIMVIPSKRHLFGLKEAIYDEPYENEVKDFDIDGFSLVEHIPVRETITLSSGDDIAALFMMTPYYYKTGRKEQERLAALTELTTEIGFEVLCYRKL